MQERNLNPELQDDWRQIVEESCYTVKAVCEIYEFPLLKLRSYIRDQKPRKPKTETFNIVVKIMSDIVDKKSMVRHPSYGYATPAEIERLNEIGVGLERDRIMNEIAKRTKSRGKKR